MIIWIRVVRIVWSAPNRNSVSWKLTRRIVMIHIWRRRKMLLLGEMERSRNEWL
jgi:hypothetical protein